MKKIILIILDGWGHSDFGDPPHPGNAIELASVPRFRRLYAEGPRVRLACSGGDVGLPDGQMGNSEVGHLNLGAGRIVYQDIARVDRAVADGTLAESLGLSAILERLDASGGTLHLVGLLSDGGVHSHVRHFEAVLDALPRELPVHVHCITDGRDTSPTGGAGFVERMHTLCDARAATRIATVTGRYFAMDRDRRWERTRAAYACIVEGRSDAAEADARFLETRYAAGVTDEFVPPTVIGEAGARGIRGGDAVLLMNFRADRMRQFTEALVMPGFDAFPREGEAPGDVVSLTRYDPAFPVRVAFPPKDIPDCLSEVVAEAELGQLKVAETEKYAHVTYFFNGGNEEPFPGEDRALIPSPKVATYDLQPEMSAAGVCDAVLRGLRGGEHHFILVNFANPDMVGHTGSIPAAVEAVETVDECLGRILDEVDASGGEWAALVTADHGNAEKMLDAEGNVHTAHTTEPVDLIVFDPASPPRRLAESGRLADVAPTVLGLMGIARPPAMTGDDLVRREPGPGEGGKR
ncbi:MAG: 2,3-bisphosphoglycerate-independent phosphoglycerate mutase [Gemmatimonadota bacterium]|nr:2,3-bisphosphoglycerate-independent phosphoglycerate mutase [Gemmatimonadota bacterium]MDH5760416.1 2,3-bisphosphoglycerate-independent phosphoglycerate mutase [Gemmatimonadota bacterium]